MKYYSAQIWLTFFCLVCGLSANAQIASSNLPIFIIETVPSSIPDEPKVAANLKVISNPDGRNQIDDPANVYDGKIGIEVRGSTSQWIFPKVGYAFETRLEDDSNNNVSLLGLPKENDWILHGPYSDKTLMRNALAYILAGRVMDYAPRVRHCELIINGEYLGVYMLLEKVKRDNDRVDVSKNNPEEDITGGYILKLDKYSGSGNLGWVSQYPPRPGLHGQFIEYQYHYPKPEDITEAQQQYIKNLIGDFEDIMNSEKAGDPLEGFESIIDKESFINYQLVNEMAKNPDGYRLSTYLHKYRDSIDHRIKMGPVWDFNLAYGNVDFCVQGAHSGWALEHNTVCEEDFWQIPFWWKELKKIEVYNDAIKERWQDLRSDILSDDEVTFLVDSLENLLLESQMRNFQRWPIMGDYIWPNYYVGDSFVDEVEHVREWAIDRLHWMDEHIYGYFAKQITEEDYVEASILKNPVQDFLDLSYVNLRGREVLIRVFDTSGRTLFIDQDYPPQGAHELSIRVNDFPMGLYYLEFRMGAEKKELIPFFKI